MSKLFRTTFGFMAVIGFLALPSAANAIELQPGQWQEIETGTEDGKPAKPETSTSCMTPEEAKDPLKGLALDKDMKGQCKTYDVKQSASGLSMRMLCGNPKEMQMDITAAFTFVSAREYNGTVKSAVTLMGKTTTSDKRIVAKRIGECKK